MKHPISFLWDIAAQKETLNLLEAQRANWFVPSHAEICRDLSALIQANRKGLLEIITALLGAAQVEIAEEPLLQHIQARFSVPDNALQHALTGYTLRSYLSYLADAGLMSVRYGGGRRLYRTVLE